MRETRMVCNLEYMACSVEKTLAVVWLDENTSHYNAMAEARTSDLPHTMTIAIAK